jgi:hypothetical protein
VSKALDSTGYGYCQSPDAALASCYILRCCRGRLPRLEKEFSTNNLEWIAQSIADLYPCRWQIEVIFKQAKQTLQLAGFLGTSATRCAGRCGRRDWCFYGCGMWRFYRIGAIASAGRNQPVSEPPANHRPIVTLPIRAHRFGAQGLLSLFVIQQLANLADKCVPVVRPMGA